MIYDVPTRWMSAYDMCERAVYLQKAIEMYVDTNYFKDLKLSKKEWDKIEYLVELLLPFKWCNQRM